MRATKQDLALFSAIRPFTDPTAAPVTYTIGGKVYRGIPAAFHPCVVTRRIDACIQQTDIIATTPESLLLRAECTQYADSPVTEWVMYITNTADTDSPIISDWALTADFRGAAPRLYHGNGDTVINADGYTWRTDALTADPLTVTPEPDGTSCYHAFPYMRLQFEDYGVNLAVGWTGTWRVEAVATEDGAALTVQQATFRSYLKPGETVRSPRMTLQIFDGGDDRGRNLWRAFYLAHILPRQDGAPLQPKLVLNTWMIDGLPEFCGATEQNQLTAIDSFIADGLTPDIWWIDAGWYPCGTEWQITGTWQPDAARFPNGLAPIGEKCREEGIDFLVWFEPERARYGSALWNEHPEFLLFCPAPDNPWLSGNALVDLGNPAACDFIIETVDALIKQSGIRVYRQDFNFPPAPYWAHNTEENREGLLENLHIQGLYRYWDALLERNPGLWIDCCASGGRRNDLENMRRSVPLHYTDVGYGHHPVKQKQHRQMYEWIPYFRGNTISWDNPDGSYGSEWRPFDTFAYHNGLAAVLGGSVNFDAPKAERAALRNFLPAWRRAAALLLSADYYPLTECRADAHDWYAAQFDGDTEGFIHIIRNVLVAEDGITLSNLHIDPARTYFFEEPLLGLTRTVTGAALLANGFTDTLPPRSGALWFYTKR